MFSALRQGAVIYILDKSKEPTVKTGYIETVSVPRPMYKTFNPAVSFGTNMQTVVDITVKVDGKSVVYEGVPSTLSIHSNGDITISESREAMISEVDATLQNSKNIVESVDKHRANITACEKILKELNPVYAKESERDEAIDSLTTKVNNMQNEFGSIKDSLSKIENLLNRQM